MTVLRQGTDTMDQHEGEGGFRLNGWHVLAICAAFFLVVASVNAVMNRAAVSSFSGVEAENPYKEGLAFNQRLAASRKQDQLGWSVDVALAGDTTSDVRAALDIREKGGLAPGGVSGLIRFEFPADRRLDRSAPLADLGGGHFSAKVAGLHPGQWDVVVELERGGEKVFVSRTRKILK
jgi:nitrogen fixation protein FixH